jgi:chromosomal replication initiation ATPase DnaA
MRPDYKWMVQPAVNDSSIRWLIMGVVCNHFGFTYEELKSKGKKTRDVFYARAAFSFILRTHLKDTLQRIGQELNTDHATISNQLKACEDLIFKNHSLKRTIGLIEQDLLNKQLI